MLSISIHDDIDTFGQQFTYYDILVEWQTGWATSYMILSIGIHDGKQHVCKQFIYYELPGRVAGFVVESCNFSPGWVKSYMILSLSTHDNNAHLVNSLSIMNFLVEWQTEWQNHATSYAGGLHDSITQYLH